MSKKVNDHQLPDIPWKHIWAVKDLNEGRQRFTLSPPAELLKELADFLDIKTLESLECALDIRRCNGQHLIHVNGGITAKITQECIHSLEIITTDIKEPFDAYFADRDQAVPFSKAKKELFSKYGVDDMPILDEEEDPEPIINGEIDLGELIVQFLSLSINPYPHVEGVESQFQEEKLEETPERQNPFAALKDWNKGDRES